MPHLLPPRAALFLVPVLLAPFVTGCASMAFRSKAEAVGQYRRMDEVNDRANDLEDREAEDVKVVVGQLPPGTDYKDGKLQVDPELYDVVATVSAEPSSRFFYPYKEGWRRSMCWPQTPLVYATLYVWLVVPTSWVCGVTAGSTEDRKERIVGALRRAAKASGGNLVLVGGFSDTVMLQSSGNQISLSETDATHGVGWALRAKGTPAVKPTAGTHTL